MVIDKVGYRFSDGSRVEFWHDSDGWFANVIPFGTNEIDGVTYRSGGCGRWAPSQTLAKRLLRLHLKPRPQTDGDDE